ncbi:MAG: KamA family radical SAM protein [Ignavibacteria bacterium]|nr:MAG: KamA family radical SAM protein [Ignavibacteria bacterium]
MISHRKMKFYGIRDLDSIPQIHNLSEDQRFEIKVVSTVLPFRVNNYVIEELIDWDNIPNDPIFQLTFMQKDMLTDDQFGRVANILCNGYDDSEIKNVVEEIRLELNPHPAGQMTMNVPSLYEKPIPGVQHKYKETVLLFPSSGQTCHAYCTFCFRWAQFVGMNDLKFATDESKQFQYYLIAKKDVTDVLITGGDPMIMSAKNLASYIEPLLEPEFEHIRNIRIGTKSVAYWPYRFVTDNDSDDILRLFEKIVNSGKHLAVMGHYNHWKELSTDVAKEAVRKIRNTGAQIRTQSPLIKHVNDNPDVWTKLWLEQVKLGCIPYYFFVERNTGPKDYFEIPLYRAYEIYKNAYENVSGLSRTVRGPSMSALPGKVSVEGITEIYGEKVFVLTLLQARNPKWVKKSFFAKFDEKATWMSDLRPAFGEDKFFYQDELNQMIRESEGHSNIQPDETFEFFANTELNADD